MSATHQAAVIPQKGERLTLQTLETPKPGPTELLISVNAIALNPVDYYMRDMGVFVKDYPATIGSDIAGTVEAVGSSIASSSFQPGTRVLGFAPAFFNQGKPPYGGFQKKVIVPVENVCVIPDTLSFVDAATLPMGVVTAWNGWTSIGLHHDTHFSAADKQSVLIWGASSSVGVCAVQTAKALGFTVYATCSPRNNEYIRSLGAKEVFDYKSPSVVQEALQAAKKDGMALTTAYFCTGDIQPCLDVLAPSSTAEQRGKLATAVPINPSTPTHPNVDTKFVMAPEGAGPRGKQFEFILQEWLAPRLADGSFIPAPEARVMLGGLAGLNDALDVLKGGVSCQKLVLEV
ncbi:uncharacterized protein Z520_06981 [Fonsecaea multimorphosa CBS 102226]|uniref:Enoyl reductase (ER) domain-containing protein n=1 Tax=Fonsecaea multimorphosa CBS 102226 TaxID=1442371 RepID=A0A0D2K335_9EURO|nr:uncharacterized protein Z520_06981 [Fonsecaea multimorphosa CBS 102226]KIX97529.1 hypothetical protein Z520_06981 [Fonsecaea multimorphosa CBS 102226]OAL23490.1 hypothetical protein AYO22_06540 [Fonsecaea multimorphosa]